MGFDLRELVLHVVGVHRLDLLAGGCAEDLDDLDELIDAALSGEEGLSEHELRHDAPGGPYVDVGRVVGRTKNELGSAVVAGADVRDIGLARDQDLGGPKVAELEDACSRVEEQVLGLDVPMTDPDGVNVGERSEKLVHVQFDLEGGHRLLELDVVAGGAVHCLWDIF